MHDPISGEEIPHRPPAEFHDRPGHHPSPLMANIKNGEIKIWTQAELEADYDS